MNLEELIRNMAANGEITHLSLTPAITGKAQRWAATFAAASPLGGHTLIIADDPVDALTAAITETKLKRRRKNAKAGNENADDAA